jgi:hypothetical protein
MNGLMYIVSYSTKFSSFVVVPKTYASVKCLIKTIHYPVNSSVFVVICKGRKNIF